MKVVTDRNGEELKVGDCVFYGNKTDSKGARGTCSVARITEIDRYIHVDKSYYGLTSQSVVKCTEKFADMYNSGEIFKI